jgi:large subunit ribosomal protein L23
MNLHAIIRKPIVTEKGVAKKDDERTLCFAVAPTANKIQIKAAVERLFKVKVASVHTSVHAGKLRRRGRFTGYRPDYKKAYVRLRKDQKMPEYAEI